MSSRPPPDYERRYLVPTEEKLSCLSLYGIENIFAAVSAQDPTFWRQLASHLVDDDVILKIEARNSTNPIMELIREWMRCDGSAICVLQNVLRAMRRDDLVDKVDILRRDNVLLTINIYRSDQRIDLSTALSVNCPGLMPLEEHVRMIVYRDLANRLVSHRYVFRLKTRASSKISWSSTAKELKGKLISVTMKEVQKNERLTDPGPQPPIIETSSGRRGMSCMDDDSIFFDYEYEEEDKANTLGVEFRPNREFIRVDRPIAMTPVQEQDDRKEDAAPRKEQPSDEQVPVQSVTSSVSDDELPTTTFPVKESDS